jgi:NAD(P)-dependent dehydrogenase (short-subunit alcohol dehydrogenase family)
MNQRFQDQVAIITGGADGLGFALAQRLVSEGAFVAIFDFAEEKLQQAQASLGLASAGFKVDITEPAAVRAAVERLVGEKGRVDILVNCAGLTGKTGVKSHEVTLEDFDHVMKVNVRGAFIMFQAVIGQMMKRNYGRVLLVSSVAGKDGNAGMLAYSTSKAAVIGMAKVQGKEYAETGITVNALAPATIRTAMVKAMPEAQIKYMTDKIPMKRCGTTDEFAAMAAYIVSPENSFTTGFTFDLTGGRATY